MDFTLLYLYLWLSEKTCKNICSAVSSVGNEKKMIFSNYQFQLVGSLELLMIYNSKRSHNIR